MLQLCLPPQPRGAPHSGTPASGIVSCETSPLRSPRPRLSEICEGLPPAPLWLSPRLEQEEDIVTFASCLGEEAILKQPSPSLPDPISCTGPLVYHCVLPHLPQLPHSPPRMAAGTCSPPCSELRSYPHHRAAPPAPLHQVVSEDQGMTLPENLVLTASLPAHTATATESRGELRSQLMSRGASCPLPILSLFFTPLL